MSLVGSEVDVRMSGGGGGGGGSPGAANASTPNTTPSKPLSRRVDSVDDLHPAVSPKGDVETLFLGADLDTEHISAAALAEQIHQVHAIRSSMSSSAPNGATTTATDDYRTCPEQLEPGDFDFDDDDDDDLLLSRSSSFPTEIDSSPFGKDALAHSREPSTPEDNTDTVYHDANMSASTSQTATDTTQHPDAAEKVYDVAKNVWEWGKGVMILSPFLGLAENVAGKVIETATGSTLKDVDGGIQSNLETVDKTYLNPAIETLVRALLGAVGKTEDVLKPILEAILKPVGLMKSDAENPELTTQPPAGLATPSKSLT